MDAAPNVSRGFNTSQSDKIQVQNTILTMGQVRGGYDIREYSKSARRELMLCNTVNIVSKDDTIIGAVLQLALVVVSSTFREYLTHKPDATSIKIANDKIDPNAVAVILRWANAIIKSPNGRFGLRVPVCTNEMIQVRFAAQALGMDIYVRHFFYQYKTAIRERVPGPEECYLTEKCIINSTDNVLHALGERLAYLRRTRHFEADALSNVDNVLYGCPKLAEVVSKSDARLLMKRN